MGGQNSERTLPSYMGKHWHFNHLLSTHAQNSADDSSPWPFRLFPRLPTPESEGISYCMDEDYMLPHSGLIGIINWCFFPTSSMHTWQSLVMSALMSDLPSLLPGLTVA
jgi:hypothetical protein